MASWTDGAAYAPLERPDGFATPEVAPLELTAPATAQTPGPMPTPTGFHPSAPTTPLEQVRTAPPATRNPSQPFEIGAGLMTVGSSMGQDTMRDPHEPFRSYGDEAPQGAGVDTLPPPTGAPLMLPTGLPVGAPGAGSVVGLSMQQQSSQRTLVFLGVVCAVLGLTIPAVAPWMLFVAGVLTLRAQTLVGKASYWSIGVGLTLLILGGVLPPEGAAGLGRLASIVFVAWFGIAASRRSRSQR